MALACKIFARFSICFAYSIFSYEPGQDIRTMGNVVVSRADWSSHRNGPGFTKFELKLFNLCLRAVLKSSILDIFTKIITSRRLVGLNILTWSRDVCGYEYKRGLLVVSKNWTLVLDARNLPPFPERNFLPVPGMHLLTPTVCFSRFFPYL